MTAVYIQRSDNVKELRFFHKDHLGSVSVVTRSDGSIEERLSYDAHGKRRNANGADGTPTIVQKDRGFTGHEMLDNVGLVHMNARIYDPQLGRFMSADPTIEFPEFSQSYNRYSYVLNNPLSFTDPSGYGLFSGINKLFKSIGKFFKRLLRNQVVRIAVAAIAAYLTYGAVVDTGILGATVEVSANEAVEKPRSALAVAVIIAQLKSAIARVTTRYCGAVAR